MRSNVLTSQIRTLLFRMVEEIQDANSHALHNDAIHAENFFCEFLNLVFGWELDNANTGNLNQEGYDLFSSINQIHVQVTTSQSHQAKYNKVAKHLQHAKAKGKYKTFILFFISKKVEKNLLDPQVINGINYQGYDLPGLLAEIFNRKKSALALQPVFDLLNAELDNIDPAKTFKISAPKQQITGLNKNQFYIDRSILITDVFQFTQAGNGLITGGPGFGKSFIIEELQRYYLLQKIPCFVIRINELLHGSKEELASELGTVSNWLQSLLTVPVNSKTKSLLIFDAFDTAKEENVKSAILKQIKTAMQELNTGWNICVSTRTYDAQKSQRLIELFPFANPNRPINCRYLEIPELKDEEITLSLAKNKRLHQAYEKSNPALKKLLHIPYFLKLFEQLATDVKSLKVSGITTEEQLLAVYWKRYVDKPAKEVLLNKLTNLLGQSESLSCSKFDVLNDQNGEIYEGLLSDGILSETSYTRQNVGFSHNILLEYAIYNYVLPGDVNDLIAFIRDNERHPFIFRSSYIYYYSSLWNNDRAAFWEHYFTLKDINSPLFRLFHQTVLNFVFCNYFESIADLQPVLNNTDPDVRAIIMRKILESIRFLRPEELTAQDVELFLLASTDLHPLVIWDLGNLVEKAIKQYDKIPGQMKKLAVTCSNYLDYVITARKIPALKLNVENNGYHWGINNYCKTYAYQKQHKILITRILEILKEDEFPIFFFYWLAGNINLIAKKDMPFALKVYATIYARTENSGAATQLGNSVVMPLRSNRKQDFNTVYHELERKYDLLLDTNAAQAIVAGIEIVDAQLLNKQTHWKKRERFPICLLGINAVMVNDHSIYDYNQEKDYGTLSHIKRIFGYFHQLAEKGEKDKLIALIKVYVHHAKSTILWVRLARFLEKRPEAFKEIACELLLSESIYRSEFTLYNAGELIKASWNYFNKSQKEKIEQSILAVPLTGYQDDRDLLAVKVQMLSCIPDGGVILASSKLILDGSGKSVNRPPFDYSMARPYTRTLEEEMQRSGVTANDSDQVSAFHLIKKVAEFNEPHVIANKEKAVKPPYPPYLPSVLELLKLRNSASFNAMLNEACDSEISRFFSVISYRVHKKSKKLLRIMEETALAYIDNPLYKTAFETGELKQNASSYSPSPRTNSTTILINLLFLERSPIIAEKVKELVGDPTQVIRLKVIRDLTYFWHFDKSFFWQAINERLNVETDGLCYAQLLSAIHYDNILAADRHMAEAALSIADRVIRQNEVSDDLEHINVIILLKLLLKFKSDKAKELIYKNLDKKSFCRQLLIECFAIIDPHNKDTSELRNGYSVELVELVKRLLEITFATIRSKSLTDPTIKDELETIDFCIQQLYFSMTTGRGNNRGNTINRNSTVSYYNKIKPILSQIVGESKDLRQGFMVAHSGYYLMQLLNYILPFDPTYILELANDTVCCAANNSFTYDHTTMTETVKLAESIFADFKSILKKKENFNKMLTILDHFSSSGWVEALQLTWRLKDIF